MTQRRGKRPRGAIEDRARAHEGKDEWEAGNATRAEFTHQERTDDAVIFFADFPVREGEKKTAEGLLVPQRLHNHVDKAIIRAVIGEP